MKLARGDLVEQTALRNAHADVTVVLALAGDPVELPMHTIMSTLTMSRSRSIVGMIPMLGTAVVVRLMTGDPIVRPETIEVDTAVGVRGERRGEAEIGDGSGGS